MLERNPGLLYEFHRSWPVDAPLLLLSVISTSRTWSEISRAVKDVSCPRSGSVTPLFRIIFKVRRNNFYPMFVVTKKLCNFFPEKFRRNAGYSTMQNGLGGVHRKYTEKLFEYNLISLPRFFDGVISVTFFDSIVWQMKHFVQSTSCGDV